MGGPRLITSQYLLSHEAIADDVAGIKTKTMRQVKEKPRFMDVKI